MTLRERSFSNRILDAPLVALLVALLIILLEVYTVTLKLTGKRFLPHVEIAPLFRNFTIQMALQRSQSIIRKYSNFEKLGLCLQCRFYILQILQWGCSSFYHCNLGLGIVKIFVTLWLDLESSLLQLKEGSAWIEFNQKLPPRSFKGLSWRQTAFKSFKPTRIGSVHLAAFQCWKGWTVKRFDSKRSVVCQKHFFVRIRFVLE